jgi:hypothetical protein
VVPDVPLKVAQEEKPPATRVGHWPAEVVGHREATEGPVNTSRPALGKGKPRSAWVHGGG